MVVRGHDIGVCSWSLRPVDAADLVARVNLLGLRHLQLGVDRLLEMDDPARDRQVGLIRDAGIAITATMVTFEGEDYSSIAIIRRTGGLAPDEQWPQRRQWALRGAALAAHLGVPYLTFHIGFVPPSSDPRYAIMLDRIRDLSVPLADAGVSLLMETGQESAPEQLQFLNDLNCRNVGVNFDPANMILYGAGDPIEAIGILGRHIRHVHVKDAVASEQPRLQWGREVVFGTGQVSPRRFLDALDQAKYTGPLVIEREAGNDRASDVRAAIDALKAADQHP